MENEVANSVHDDIRFEEWLRRIWHDNLKLYVREVHFNPSTFNCLTEFLENSPRGRQLSHLHLDRCTFDKESRALFQEYFSSNESRTTLKAVSLDHLACTDLYKILLRGFHNNTTVTELSIDRSSRGANLRDTRGGAMFGDLLQQNLALTTLNLDNLGKACPRFIRAIRDGLLASRTRLQSLSLRYSSSGNNGALTWLSRIYSSRADGYDINNTALKVLDISWNCNITGAVGRNFLRQLLEALPHLTKLNVSHNRLDSDCTRTLFQVIAVMGRLKSLSVRGCGIDNGCLAQVVESTAVTLSLVDLNFSSNRVQGAAGGESLAAFLRHFPLLETLDLSYNAIENGATASILTSLTSIPCLKSVNLGGHDLPPTTLVPLTAFLNGTIGGSLEVLGLAFNRELLGEVNGSDYQGPFFDALANHKTLNSLSLFACDMNEHTEGLLVSAASQNTTLLLLDHNIRRVEVITREYMQRNKLLTKIEATMKKPVDIPMIFWPDALAACTRQTTETGNKAPIYFVVQKMMESNNIFQHTAAVYYFEKVRACKQVQQWWQQRR